MRKYLLGFISVIMIVTIAGCGGNEDNKEKTSVNNEETSSEIISVLDEEDTSVVVDESTSETTTEIAPETTTVAAEEETTTKEKQTKKETQKQTNKPVETTTQKNTENTTSKPAVTEAPIVTKVGNVDAATYNKAVSAFESIVKKMRKDGIVKASDTCVVMEGSTLKVDINYGDKDVDLILKYDGNSKVYELVLDYNFSWLSELAVKINGKDSAPYNRELIKATLSMVSNEVDAVFDRIDMDCYSANSLDTEKWSWSGDCFIKSGQFKVDQLFSYYLTKEK